jgi:ribose 5-phosphate isomerase B
LLDGGAVLAIGSDHAGFELKRRIAAYLKESGWSLEDFGVNSPESVDYPDIAARVAGSVQEGVSDKGILICGTGLGMSIAANKMRGVRAALCHDPFSARQSRLHNDANVLVLGAWITGEGLAKDIVDVWLHTGFEGGRHERRVKKIGLLEGSDMVSFRVGSRDEDGCRDGSVQACMRGPSETSGNVPEDFRGTGDDTESPKEKEQEDRDAKVLESPTESFDLEAIRTDLESALKDLLAAASLEPGQILVVGCSTSEIQGKKIGKASSVEIADTIMDVLLRVASENRVYLAIQGCEHINRSLVITREALKRYDLEEVSVYPVLHAGGALAATAMDRIEDPVLVERVRAHAGVDIGDALIGMHLRVVAVPVRSPVKRIGLANLVMARTRPRLVGGARAQYRGVKEK